MSPSEPHFYYRNGLAVLRGGEDAPAWMIRDRRVGGYVAAGHRLPELRAWARERGIGERGSAPDPLDAPLFDLREPREYQKEAPSATSGWAPSTATRRTSGP